MKTHTKKLLAIIALLTVSLYTSAQFSGGDGSESNPYIITTPEQLAQLRNYVNEGNESYNDKHYKLGNDISLSNYQSGAGWTPIGTFLSRFLGSFDGNNNKITNLRINSTNLTYVGLFGYIEEGTIKNLGVVDVNITSTRDNTSNVGGIVGYFNNGIITNCYTTGTVSGASTSNNYEQVSCTGGVVGYGDFCKISDCNSTCTVTDSGKMESFVGGVVGRSFNNISNCHSTGKVTATNTNSSSHAGGVGGQIYGNISNCYSTGDVQSSGSYCSVGGVVGEKGNFKISNCYSTGTVIASGNNGSSHVGGIAGKNIWGSGVSNCYSTGSITSSNNNGYSYAGGIVGKNEGSYEILSNCYSTGTVTASGSSVYAGGMVGSEQNGGGVSNCYTISYVVVSASSAQSYLGGLVGYNGNESSVSNSAALNPRLTRTGSNVSFGRVLGDLFGRAVPLTSNIAFNNMLNPSNTTTWNNKGASNLDGQDMTAETINGDGTLGNRFTGSDGWTTQNGKLPGLFGETVEMPEHLRITSSFTITASVDGGNGTITPSGVTTVNQGGSQVYTITPNAGYSIAQVLIDDVNNPAAVSSGSYTFTNVTANHTIVASFTTNTFTITASVDGGNGTITPSGVTTVNQGGSQVYTIIPNAGYSIAQVLIDGVNNPAAVASGSYTFTNVTANHTIIASFTINTFTISASVDGGNGTITPSGTVTINHGENQTFNFTPNTGYNIAQVLIDGVNNSAAVTSGSYTFTNVTANHTIVVSFTINTYTITASVNGGNGRIQPSGVTTVNHGGNQTYNITPNNGYHIEQVLVDGVNIPEAVTNGKYTFTNVTANHTIVASFVINSYLVNVVANPLEGGAVTGGGTYFYGESITIVATANTDFNFLYWTYEEGQIFTNSYTFTVTQNVTFSANFDKINKYNLAIIVNPAGAGTVTGEGLYNHGDNVSVTATANGGYIFLNWTENGNIVETNTSYNFIITDNTVLTANFDYINPCTVTLSSDPAESGILTGARRYPSGALVTVSAVGKPCYEFLYWKNVADNQIVSEISDYSFIITEDVELVAYFKFNKSYRVMRLKVQPK